MWILSSTSYSYLSGSTSDFMGGFMKSHRKISCDRCRKTTSIGQVNLLPGQILCKRCLVIHKLVEWISAQGLLREEG